MIPKLLGRYVRKSDVSVKRMGKPTHLYAGDAFIVVLLYHGRKYQH